MEDGKPLISVMMPSIERRMDLLFFKEMVSYFSSVFTIVLFCNMLSFGVFC